ncbi:MAG: chromosomal replication initiator protein DnaA [Parcubacteria group bacterium CG11_big_fil_rev_8_21_14_0_20_39_14]|nr:MAG: chromosomal replication initiator protein DnaA [Parcubacteria group bacterium CG11_big_fil_rev_8_21_14_0_20_39_14]
MTNEELWQIVLNEMELKISQANFATWFKETSISSIKNGVAVIAVPSDFAKEWFVNKYHKTIFEIIKKFFPDLKTVGYLLKQQQTPQDFKKQAHFITQNKNQLQFQELKIDKKTNLNPKYTFDNFIVGSFNELAHAAACSIIQKPGQVYNPLFVYGGVGVGKTHLLQAIGNKLNQNEKLTTIKYTQAEKFSQELVQAIRNKSMDNFKEKYRKLDLLIIDDVQFITGKNKTQEELFHTFNSLYDKNKQIVFSSDRPPNAIPLIEERLRSRFEGGMIADISHPDFETRLAILKSKCSEKEIKISEEILNWIASHIQKNIRELEGALNKVAATNSLNGNSLGEKEFKKILKDFTCSMKKNTTPQKIIESVSNFYDVKIINLTDKTRKKEFVHPRQVAMYLLRSELNLSYPSIGEKFGKRDHTTSIHSCEKIKKELEENESLNEEINMVKQLIYV